MIPVCVLPWPEWNDPGLLPWHPCISGKILPVFSVNNEYPCFNKTIAALW
jgi:hypothetical protein